MSGIGSRIGLIVGISLACLTAIPSEAAAQSLDDLVVEGMAVAASDPLAAELRRRQSEPALRGFDIGMAVARADTMWGPGKQRILESLPPFEQQGFQVATSYLMDRNRNADYAARGASIATADIDTAVNRRTDPDVRYWLGFDVATGIFGNPEPGGQGNTAMGPGAQAIRNGLSEPAQRGFDASAAMHLARSRQNALPGAGPVLTGGVRNHAGSQSAELAVLAARGQALVNSDIDLSRFISGYSSRVEQDASYVAVAVAYRDTLWGPGKARIGRLIPVAGQHAYYDTVYGVLRRNNGLPPLNNSGQSHGAKTNGYVGGDLPQSPPAVADRPH